MSYLQDITDGPHVKDAQRLLNELSAARRCLLDPEKKAAYDAELKAELATERKPPKSAPPSKPPQAAKPSAPPAPPKTLEEPPIAFADTAPRLAGKKSMPQLSGEGESGNQERQSPATKRKKKPPMPLIAGGIAALIVVLIVVVGLLLSGRDNDESEHAKGTEKRETPTVVAEKPPERPQLIDTESPLAEIAAKVPLDDPPPPPDSGDESPDAADGIAEERPSDRSPAAVIHPNGSPAQVDNLLLWLDASDGSTVTTGDDACIAQWTDKSGKQCHAKADTEYRPVLVQDVLNGMPVVRFSGAHCLEIEGKSEQFKTGSEYTFIFVGRGETGTLLSKGSGSSDGSFAMSDGVTSFHAGGEDLNAADDDGEEFRVRSIAGDHESLRWYVDGRPSGSYSKESHAVRATSLVRIGAFQKRGKGLQSFFAGELAELLIYNRPLADDERQSIEAYLQQKWLSAGTAPPVPIAETEPPQPKEAEEETPDSSDEPEEVASEDAEDMKPAETEESEREPDVQAEQFTLLVNLGGEGFEDPEGKTWVKSKDFDGATFGHEGGRSVKTDEVENPGAKTALRGLTAFRAIVPNGDYKVVLYFSEHWTTDPTRRMFSVFVEQRPVLRPNVFRAPGLGQPYSHVIPKVAVTDGRLDVDFSPAAPGSSTILNGISIQQIR
jgi:hypothetical protein